MSPPSYHTMPSCWRIYIVNSLGRQISLRFSASSPYHYYRYLPGWTFHQNPHPLLSKMPLDWQLLYPKYQYFYNGPGVIICFTNGFQFRKSPQNELNKYIHIYRRNKKGKEIQNIQRKMRVSCPRGWQKHFVILKIVLSNAFMSNFNKNLKKNVSLSDMSVLLFSFHLYFRFCINLLW